MGTNILWWMAEVGIDGLRIDTYTYGHQDAMAAMTRRIADAFPESFMFAEAWVYGSAKQAAIVEGAGFDGEMKPAWMAPSTSPGTSPCRKRWNKEKVGNMALAQSTRCLPRIFSIRILRGL